MSVPGCSATWGKPYLLVISNVVPKICARTNSAMVMCGVADAASGACGSVCGGQVLVLVRVEVRWL
jgi:hypothetical protein